MPERIEITAEEYEEYKRLKQFENEISDSYRKLYLQVLHMKLLVFACSENESDREYPAEDMFDLLFYLCEEMYPCALEIQNFIHRYACGDEQ